MDDWFARDVKRREYIRRLRWPAGFACFGRGVTGEPWEMARQRLRCRACGPATGTVVQDTRKPLRVGFLAVRFVTSRKIGASAFGLQRMLGLGSYEPAWPWLHKFWRAMVRPGRDRLTGALAWKHRKAAGRMAVTVEEDFAEKVRRSMRDPRNDARKIISFLQKPSLKCPA